MFDSQVAPAFVKCYYENYLTNPMRLESMYTQNASYSHGDVAPLTHGGTHHTNVSSHVKGVDEIRSALKKLQDRNTASAGGAQLKICFTHIDAVPSGAQTMSILVGGYFLFPDGSSRFTHSFVLQSTSVRNNYLIISDMLRTYPRQPTDSKTAEKRPTETSSNRNTRTQATKDATPAPQAPTPTTAPAPAAAVKAHEQEVVKAAAPAKQESVAPTKASDDAPEKTKTQLKSAVHPSHPAHPGASSRSWSDLMDETDEAHPPTKPHSDMKRETKAEVAKQTVSSYAAAVRLANASGVDKPTQKIGGISAVPAQVSAGEEHEGRSHVGGRGVGRSERTNGHEEHGDNKRAGTQRNNYTNNQEGKSGEGRPQFIKYCAILKNLPADSSDEEIIGLLAPHVKVTSVRNGTSNGRTYAFVKFDDESVIPTIQKAGLSLHGNRVDIEKVVDKYAHQRRNNQGNGEQSNRNPNREGDSGNAVFQNRRFNNTAGRGGQNTNGPRRNLEEREAH